jgi:hypothetical protein
VAALQAFPPQLRPRLFVITGEAVVFQVLRKINVSGIYFCWKARILRLSTFAVTNSGEK